MVRRSRSKAGMDVGGEEKGGRRGRRRERKERKGKRKRREEIGARERERERRWRQRQKLNVDLEVPGEGVQPRREGACKAERLSPHLSTSAPNCTSHQGKENKYAKKPSETL